MSTTSTSLDSIKDADRIGILRILIHLNRLPDDLVERAKMIAEVAHRDQVDKLGEPYIDHPAHVASALKAVGHDQSIVAAAWLHDTVEDSELTVADIRHAFPNRPDIAAAVAALTHQPHEPADDYYARVAANPIAKVVKLADIAHNTSAQRFERLDEATRERLSLKYANAMRYLLGETLDEALAQLDASTDLPSDDLSDIDRVRRSLRTALTQTVGDRAAELSIELAALVIDAIKPMVITVSDIGDLPPRTVIRDDAGHIFMTDAVQGLLHKVGSDATVTAESVSLPAYVLDLGY